VVAATALVVGASLGDLGIVVMGGLGVRRAGERLSRYIKLILAAVLAGIGLWLLLSGML
jgi:hypothetical protein